MKIAPFPIEVNGKPCRTTHKTMVEDVLTVNTLEDLDKQDLDIAQLVKNFNQVSNPMFQYTAPMPLLTLLPNMFCIH